MWIYNYSETIITQLRFYKHFSTRNKTSFLLVPMWEFQLAVHASRNNNRNKHYIKSPSIKCKTAFLVQGFSTNGIFFRFPAIYDKLKLLPQTKSHNIKYPPLTWQFQYECYPCLLKTEKKKVTKIACKFVGISTVTHNTPLILALDKSVAYSWRWASCK